jgi:hypothetical protein
LAISSVRVYFRKISGFFFSKGLSLIFQFLLPLLNHVLGLLPRRRQELDLFGQLTYKELEFEVGKVELRLL